MKNLTSSLVVAISLAGFCAAKAALVSFSLAGYIDYVQNPFGLAPATIQYGTPFTATFSYDTATIAEERDFSSDPAEGDYYFTTNCILNMSMMVGGHSFANIPHTQKYPYGAVIVYNNYLGEDMLDISDSMPHLRMDGGALPGNCDDGGMELRLVDTNGTSYHSDSLPLAPPLLANCGAPHQIMFWGIKTNQILFTLYGTVTNLITAGQPFLTVKSLPNKSLLLSWPIGYQGFKLLQNTNPAAGAGWTTNATAIVDTATDHTVTLPASKTSCLFRLKSP